jgi:hypothetical protein
MPQQGEFNEATRARPRFTGLLLAIGAIVILLTVVFGASISSSRAAFDAYKSSTLIESTPIWEREVLSVEACVEHTVEWGVHCPGLESWCTNEAPQLTLRCLERDDRAEYCRDVGGDIASTRFGYRECEALRERVDGKYAKRHHKKYCAAAQRAVAEHCRTVAQTGS